MRSLRTKLKLNNQQKTLMAQHAGYSRWVYNWGLSLWNQAYEDGYQPNSSKLRDVFTNQTKPLYPWMNKLSSRVYQYAFINLSEAFKRFFKGLGKHPTFKKKGNHDSFTIDNCGKPIELDGWNHKLPFIGWVKTYEPIEATTKKITISRQANDWYLSCSYEFTPVTTVKHTEVVGVDLGIKTLATVSTGEVFPSIKPYGKAQEKLSKLQRQLGRKVKHSRNWYKVVIKLARQHRRVANIRSYALNKLTTYLAKNHGKVAIEDLNVSGMLANHKLALSIADQGFYEFRRQLEYKCLWYGCELIVVNRFYPSSKTCSSCGHVQDMPLHLRTYDCPECGISIDRDLNASINLRNAVGLTVNACG